mgnify:CR=1 FL=1
MTTATGAARVPSQLPESVRGRLEELTQSLADALGPNLASLVVFGSAVRGGFRDGASREVGGEVNGDHGAIPHS